MAGTSPAMTGRFMREDGMGQCADASEAELHATSPARPHGHSLPNEHPDPRPRLAAPALQLLDMRIDLLGGRGGSWGEAVVCGCIVASAFVMIISSGLGNLSTEYDLGSSSRP
jgi:hypothetical protein